MRKVGTTAIVETQTLGRAAVGGASDPHAPARHGYAALGKPVVDRLAGSVLLMLFAPVLVVIAVVVRLHRGSGVLPAGSGSGSAVRRS